MSIGESLNRDKGLV